MNQSVPLTKLSTLFDRLWDQSFLRGSDVLPEDQGDVQVGGPDAASVVPQTPSQI